MTGDWVEPTLPGIPPARPKAECQPGPVELDDVDDSEPDVERPPLPGVEP